MLPRTLALLPLLLLTACSDLKDPLSGFHNPFHQDHKPFVETPVPADFSIVIDEYRLAAGTRQHLRQIITAEGQPTATSRTTLTTHPATGTTTEQSPAPVPVPPAQLQLLWNQISSARLLDSASNGTPPADLPNNQTVTLVRIQANGTFRNFNAANEVPAPIRPFMPLLESLRPTDLQTTPATTAAPTTTAPASHP